MLPGDVALLNPATAALLVRRGDAVGVDVPA
jgi:hypothetical protein